MGVLRTRFRTIVITDLERLRSQLAGQGCDLVILCHSLKPDDAQQACDIVKEVRPETKLLALIASRTRLSMPACPDEFMAHEGPAALVARVAGMLGVDAGARAGAPTQLKARGTAGC